MRQPDTAWRCGCCDRPIALDGRGNGVSPGVSLDGTLEPHVCRDCHGLLTPWQKLEASRTFRTDRELRRAAEAVADLCELTMARPLIEPGRN